MKKIISLSLLTAMLLAASGCSKFRSLTRRDYAFLSDPFAARGDDDAAPADAEQSTSGYVKINDSEPNTAVANYNTVSDTKSAEAQTASSATGFQGIRVRGMGDAISTEIGSFVSGSDAPSGESRDSGSLIADSDFESGSSSKDNSGPPTDSAAVEVAEALLAQPKPANSPVASEPPADLLAGFDDWAASRRDEWAESNEPEKPLIETKETAAPLIRQPIRQVSETVTESSSDSSDVATPLLQKDVIRHDRPDVSPLARPIMPERTLQRNSTAVLNPDTAFAPPLADSKQEFTSEFEVPDVTPKSEFPPSFDAPEKRPLIEDNRSVKENPFALIAKESGQSPQPDVKPAPKFDDFKSADDSQWKAGLGTKPAKPSDTQWFVPQDSVPDTEKTIDAEFSFDNAWKPVEAEKP